MHRMVGVQNFLMTSPYGEFVSIRIMIKTFNAVAYHGWNPWMRMMSPMVLPHIKENSQAFEIFFVTKCRTFQVRWNSYTLGGYQAQNAFRWTRRPSHQLDKHQIFERRNQPPSYQPPKAIASQLEKDQVQNGYLFSESPAWLLWHFGGQLDEIVHAYKGVKIPVAVTTINCYNLIALSNWQAYIYRAHKGNGSTRNDDEDSWQIQAPKKPKEQGQVLQALGSCW